MGLSSKSVIKCSKGSVKLSNIIPKQAENKERNRLHVRSHVLLEGDATDLLLTDLGRGMQDGVDSSYLWIAKNETICKKRLKF